MFSNPRTTIGGLVTVLAWIAARFGFDVPKDVTDAIIVVGVFVVGLLARDTNKSKDESVCCPDVDPTTIASGEKEERIK